MRFSSQRKRFKLPVDKTITINSVINTSFQGCQMTTLSQVTVRRKNRQMHHGIISFAGPVTSLNDTELCVGRLRFTRADLSADAAIGYAGHDWVTQTSIPEGTCFPR